MSNDLNLCQFIGRLGKDPETRYMPNGDAVANFSIAVGSSWKDKNSGEKKESTEWVRVTVFRKLAEIIAQYLKKGSQVYISGKLRTRTYEKDGQTHYATEIIADSMQMLGSRNSGSTERTEPRPAIGGGGEHKPESDFDDDIPFITRDGIK